MVLGVKNLTANTGDTRDAGSIPGKSKRTEETDGLQSMGSQRIGHELKQLSTHACMSINIKETIKLKWQL